MRNLKSFEEFLKLGDVKKQKPDIERAKSLILESKDKLSFFKKVKEKLGKENLNPNFVVETCYDILIQLIRAKLLSDGYKAGFHQAEVSYMRKLSFSEYELNFMNELRYFRNGIKYYGKKFDKEYAEKAMIFLNKLFPKLLQILKLKNN